MEGNEEQQIGESLQVRGKPNQRPGERQERLGR